MTKSVIQRASRTLAFVGSTLAAGEDNFLRLIAASESHAAEVELGIAVLVLPASLQSVSERSIGRM